jgi:predicted PurR-regulated permease PerM
MCFQACLLPFVAGAAVAYLLDPVCDRLEKLGMGRLWATFTILLAFVFLLILFFILLLPVLGNQLASFLERFPELVRQLQGLVNDQMGQRLAEAAGINLADLQASMAEMVGQGAAFVGKLAQSVWSGGQALSVDPVSVRHHARRGILPAARLGSHDRKDRRLAAARSS